MFKSIAEAEAFILNSRKRETFAGTDDKIIDAIIAEASKPFAIFYDSKNRINVMSHASAVLFRSYKIVKVV